MKRFVLLIALFTPGCVVMGRATQGEVPDLSRLTVIPGETTLREVLQEIGPPAEWYRTGRGTLLIYRHRTLHFGRYGLEIGFVSYAFPGNLLVDIITDNLHISYERTQQAEVRLAILVDPTGTVLSYGARDERGRLTVF